MDKKLRVERLTALKGSLKENLCGKCFCSDCRAERRAARLTKAIILKSTADNGLYAAVKNDHDANDLMCRLEQAGFKCHYMTSAFSMEGKLWGFVRVSRRGVYTLLGPYEDTLEVK